MRHPPSPICNLYSQQRSADIASKISNLHCVPDERRWRIAFASGVGESSRKHFALRLRQQEGGNGHRGIGKYGEDADGLA